ncbi:methyl-accepting chemotaxis protein [Bradyrhizobium ontarionense]|uniref:Methyl-accepting chemotaxis protein n=1 Tax=Bradyrhizobium ontarionense TaxID=2898149 RepID=A0ABY3RJU0_9BRAD|nr:methyl-accepting chemotaxis protein [Bradyrhizobium sp. A19]UFZ06899.1 methyl-accepting chemotaxis protein [Bradyrhizobium sp. A19]
MLAHYSIRAKIIAVAAFLLVAITGMGWLAIANMRAINANTVDIATSWLPSVRVLGELQERVVMNRNIVRAHLLAETLEDKLKVELALNANFETVAKTVQAYQPLITSAEERAIYDNWSGIWNQYKRDVADVLALSRKEAGQFPREATALNSSKVNRLLTDADALLKKDIALNNAGAEKASQEAADSYASAFVMVAAILAVTLLAGILLSLYLIRDVSAGIGSIVKPMQALGEGDLSAEVPYRGVKTEIGAMADALQLFKEALIAKKDADEATARDAEAKIARGRRVDEITRTFEAAIGEIVNTVSSASSQLEASAGTLTTTANRSKQLATTVASASEEATANVQSVASATEQMASSVSEIGRQVQESARMANDAVGQARTTTGRVSELSKAATRIGDVVELINTIAGQTNLLALNATIEAARAGDAGRGFAVVASEVKALAEQTAKATGEIGLQISGIQAATLESVDAIKDISTTIERLSEISSTIAAAVEEQGTATQEISRNVQQAARGTQQVSTNITDVERGAADTGSASTQVLAAAQALSGDSGRLSQEVSRFLSSVRAV